MTKVYFFAAVLFFSSFTVKSQTVKGLYVDGFISILGNTSREDSLLNYAQYNGFNYLALYDLWQVHTTYNLTTSSTCTVLANFIQKAKQNYGISQVGAIGENFFVFNNVFKIYNQQHTSALQKFDVYNVEFEFWNTNSVSAGNYYCTTYLQPNYTCDTAGAFAYYKKVIHQVDSLANATGIVSETYVGWFNQGQAVTIANTVDRILLHDYISNYTSLYSYIQQRLQYIASRNVITDVIPIFSAEPSFMGPWLNTHNVVTPYTDLQADLSNEPGTWKQYINLKGYQWFAYSFMPYNVSATGQIDTKRDNVRFFPNPAGDRIWIEGVDIAKVKFGLLDCRGEEVIVKSIESEQGISIDLSGVNNGIYFLVLQAASYKTMTKVVVIK